MKHAIAAGVETERLVEPQHVVVGPDGSHLSAWCQLREDDRVSAVRPRIFCQTPT